MSRRWVIGWAGWLVAGIAMAVGLSAIGVLPGAISHLAPVVTCASLLALALVAWRRPIGGRVLLAVLATASAGMFVLTAPDIGQLLRLRPPASTADRSVSVSVVELNAWDFNPDRRGAIAWLRRTNADIIILAEAREAFIIDLRKAFPDYPTLITCQGRPYCGVVVLSRFPGRLLPGGWRVADGLNNTSPDNPGIPFAAVELFIPGADGQAIAIPVMGVHLNRQGLAGVDGGHVDALLAAVSAASEGQTSRAMLAGDFNASPWSHEMRRFAGASGLARAGPLAPTWPSPVPVLFIDQIHLGCGWTTRAFAAGPQIGSDHRPLVAHFLLRADATAACRNAIPSMDRGGSDPAVRPGR